MKTIVVRKSQSAFEERMFVDPPRTIFLSPTFQNSYSFVMEVGGLQKMLKDLDPKDSFRIEIFPDRQTEYSFINHDKKRS